MSPRAVTSCDPGSFKQSLFLTIGSLPTTTEERPSTAVSGPRPRRQATRHSAIRRGEVVLVERRVSLSPRHTSSAQAPGVLLSAGDRYQRVLEKMTRVRSELRTGPEALQVQSSDRDDHLPDGVDACGSPQRARFPNGHGSRESVQTHAGGEQSDGVPVLSSRPHRRGCEMPGEVVQRSAESAGTHKQSSPGGLDSLSGLFCSGLSLGMETGESIGGVDSGTH